MEKVLFSWSGGKDSALALHQVLSDERWDVVGLLTTLTGRKKVPMHEVGEKFIRRQIESIGIPLVPVYLPDGVDNDTYESCLSAALTRFKKMGVEKVAHGDIFLEDVKQYREDQLAKIDMKGVYPLWGENTSELAERFISQGFQSIVTCVDTSVLGKEFAGREYDRSFLADLPETIDPCGENGEFHTFVYDGPIFRGPVHFKKAENYTTGNGRFVHLHLK